MCLNYLVLNNLILKPFSYNWRLPGVPGVTGKFATPGVLDDDFGGGLTLKYTYVVFMNLEDLINSNE